MGAFPTVADLRGRLVYGSGSPRAGQLRAQHGALLRGFVRCRERALSSTGNESSIGLTIVPKGAIVLGIEQIQTRDKRSGSGA
jgi:hypothetical protein